MMAMLESRSGTRGGMGAMYQRGKIQEESLYYEHKKHDGSLPLVGVNTFLPKEHAGEAVTEIELIRSTEEEKGQQIENVRRWQQSRNVLAPVGETEHGHVVEDDAAAATEPHDGHGLGYLQKTARERRNVFAALMRRCRRIVWGRSVMHCMTCVGRYRRNM
jgi:methylmalonyl-CoA mutase